MLITKILITILAVRVNIKKRKNNANLRNSRNKSNLNSDVNRADNSKIIIKFKYLPSFLSWGLNCKKSKWFS